MSTKSATKFDLQRFHKRYKQVQLELQSRQRQYTKSLKVRLPVTRQQHLLIEAFKDGCQKMKEEKNALKAQIWTASGRYHKERNNQALNTIKCLLDCNISLNEEAQYIKLTIQYLEHKLNILGKDITHMRMVQRLKCRRDLEKVNKSLRNLEDQYENLLQLECKLSARSKKLRFQIWELLNERKQYHSLYAKYIQRLTSEKKYLTDLIDFALDQIEMVIAMYEKLEHQRNHIKRELKKRAEAKRSAYRRRLSLEKQIVCNEPKLKHRELADIPEKEIRRRNILRNKYLNKINLYNGILKKILKYTNAENIRAVTVNFQRQESLYYSFSNISNEISYRITLLNNSVARLFGEIHELKLGNRDKQRAQIEMIAHLETVLQEKRNSNEDLRKMVHTQNERIGKLFEALQLIRDQSRTDLSALEVNFDNHHEINIENMRKQMKILEQRIYSIVCVIYTQERQGKSSDPSVTYLVRNVEKLIDQPTPINNIVLTTQCAECSKNDAKEIDDLSIMPTQQVKKLVAEKVVQPEMQYRLHNINQCRLPRSRKLMHSHDE